MVKEVRSWSHVSGYFRIHSFSFPESAFSPFTCIHIEFTFPHVCDGIRIHSIKPRPTCYAAYLFTVWKIHCKLDTILLRHRIRKYPDSPSTHYRIRCGFLFFFFQLWEADACGQEALTGKRELLIKTFTHTWGQGWYNGCIKLEALKMQ